MSEFVQFFLYSLWSIYNRKKKENFQFSCTQSKQFLLTILLTIRSPKNAPHRTGLIGPCKTTGNFSSELLGGLFFPKNLLSRTKIKRDVHQFFTFPNIIKKCPLLTRPLSKCSLRWAVHDILYCVLVLILNTIQHLIASAVMSTVVLWTTVV